MAVKFEEDWRNMVCVCSSDKMSVAARIDRIKDGYGFFQITFEKGQVPEQLSGRYSTLAAAKKAFISYEANRKESEGKKREYFREQRELKKNAAAETREGS
jgi:hypothetical protein